MFSSRQTIHYGKKIAVQECYDRLKKENQDPSSRALAKAAGVSKNFALKIIKEIKEQGAITPVKEITTCQGIGSRVLAPGDAQFLLDLRSRNNKLRNIDYVIELREKRGIKVSVGFITQFFQKIGPFKGNFKVPSMVPMDKYHPKNIKKWDDYIFFIRTIDPR